MAKKTAKKSVAASKKTAKAPKAAAKKPAAGKKKSSEKVECVEIELGPAEEKALLLAHSSEAVCEELELAVTEAIAKAVRNVFKSHDVALSAAESQQVALFLFGDCE
jgi:hypothetical protein